MWKRWRKKKREKVYRSRVFGRVWKGRLEGKERHDGGPTDWRQEPHHARRQRQRYGQPPTTNTAIYARIFKPCVLLRRWRCERSLLHAYLTHTCMKASITKLHIRLDGWKWERRKAERTVRLEWVAGEIEAAFPLAGFPSSVKVKCINIVWGKKKPHGSCPRASDGTKHMTHFLSPFLRLLPRIPLILGGCSEAGACLVPGSDREPRAPTLSRHRATMIQTSVCVFLMPSSRNTWLFVQTDAKFRHQTQGANSSWNSEEKSSWVFFSTTYHSRNINWFVNVHRRGWGVGGSAPPLAADWLLPIHEYLTNGRS